jgi:hypothetical protein
MHVHYGGIRELILFVGRRFAKPWGRCHEAEWQAGMNSMKQYFVPVILMLVMHSMCGAISFHRPGSGGRHVARLEADPAGVEMRKVPSHRLPKACPVDIENCFHL